MSDLKSKSSALPGIPVDRLVFRGKGPRADQQGPHPEMPALGIVFLQPAEHQLTIQFRIFYSPIISEIIRNTLFVM